MIYINLENDSVRVAEALNKVFMELTKTSNIIQMKVASNKATLLCIEDNSEIATIIKAEHTTIEHLHTEPENIELEIGQRVFVKLHKEGTKTVEKELPFKIVKIDKETSNIWMLCEIPIHSISTYTGANYEIWEAEFNIGLFTYRATRDGSNYIVLPSMKDINEIGPELASNNNWCYWLGEEDPGHIEDHGDWREHVPGDTSFAVNENGEIEEVLKNSKLAVCPIIKFSLDYYEKQNNLSIPIRIL